MLRLAPICVTLALVCPAIAGATPRTERLPHPDQLPRTTAPPADKACAPGRRLARQGPRRCVPIRCARGTLRWLDDGCVACPAGAVIPPGKRYCVPLRCPRLTYRGGDFRCVLCGGADEPRCRRSLVRLPAALRHLGQAQRRRRRGRHRRSSLRRPAATPRRSGPRATRSRSRSAARPHAGRSRYPTVGRVATAD